jgi:hypothetical protein
MQALLQDIAAEDDDVEVLDNPDENTDASILSSELNSIGVERPTEDDMGQIDALGAEQTPPPEASGQVNTGAASPLGSAPAPGAPQA